MRADHSVGWVEVKMIVNSTRILALHSFSGDPHAYLDHDVRPPMDLDTLFDEMSEYDDFWDYNIGRMRLLPVQRDTPMDLWRHTAIRCGIEHRLEGADLRRFRADRAKLTKAMPHFPDFLESIKARHPAICDCNFPNWMERDSDGMLVWSDPITCMTDAEKLDFIDRYDCVPSLGYALG
jgi:hypothetical protein